jgi:hypothetical protein
MNTAADRTATISRASLAGNLNVDLNLAQRTDDQFDVANWAPEPGTVLRVGHRVTDRSGHSLTVTGTRIRALGITYVLTDVDTDGTAPPMEMFAVDVDRGIGDGDWTVEIPDAVETLPSKTHAPGDGPDVPIPSNQRL